MIFMLSVVKSYSLLLTRILPASRNRHATPVFFGDRADKEFTTERTEDTEEG